MRFGESHPVSLKEEGDPRRSRESNMVGPQPQGECLASAFQAALPDPAPSEFSLPVVRQGPSFHLLDWVTYFPDSPRGKRTAGRGGGIIHSAFHSLELPSPSSPLLEATR